MMKSTQAVSNRKFLFFTDYSERKMVAPKLPPRSPECMKKAKNFGKQGGATAHHRKSKGAKNEQQVSSG